MTPLETIVKDVARGKLFLDDLLKKRVLTNKFGVCMNDCSCGVPENCLWMILDSLEFTIVQEILDPITELLYTELILIIGYSNEPPVPVFYNITYGYSPVNYVNDYENIIFQFTKQLQIGSTSISLDYTMPSFGNYLFFRVPTGQPVFNIWTIDIDEHGVIPDIQWRKPVTFGLYDYYLSRQLIFLNPGNTMITYTGSVVPFQPINISLTKQSSVTVTGPIEVNQEGVKIFDLNLDDAILLNRIIPKDMSYKNLTGSEVGVSVNGEDNLYILPGESYTLTDLNSTTPKTIVFQVQDAG